MQNITSLLIVPCLLGLYGIYLAIAAFVSDFVYFLTGSRSRKIKIKAMDSQEIRIKTSLMGILWVVISIFVSFVVTEGRLFHILARAMTDDHGRAAQMQDIRSRDFTNVGVTKTGTFFEILTIEPRQGVFESVTWDDDLQKPAPQFYTVDADLGSDIHAAVIARIITVIREHQNANINWRSARLGRVVVLSMRPEDDVELSHFLTSEFFGS
ncbi:MAG: hypothetical protein JWP38_1339 [Herbaspirillum sp.]|jgi:hypothetical protein|nr:hypothetical protein [Herbaspirillum sp.]